MATGIEQPTAPAPPPPPTAHDTVDELVRRSGRNESPLRLEFLQQTNDDTTTRSPGPLARFVARR